MDITLLFSSILIVVASGQEIPELILQPESEIKELETGKNYFVYCSLKNIQDGADGNNLLTDLKWTRDGVQIPSRPPSESETPRVYTEYEARRAAMSLIITDIKLEDDGIYECSATYAGNIPLKKTQKLSILQGISWTNCRKSQNIILGQKASVECSVQANPPAVTDWSKDGEWITTDDNRTLGSEGLTINSVSVSDAGMYSIRAKVMQTGALSDMQIAVKVLVPPTIVDPPQDTDAVEGKETKLHCKADGDPKPTITWLDPENGDLSERPEEYTVDKNTGELIIKDVKKSDEGSYTCVADNDAGKLEAKANLNVIVMPKIIEFLNRTADEDTPATFTCKSTGDPAPEITVQKYGNEPYTEDVVNADDRLSIDEKMEDGVKVLQLTFRNVLKQDDGLYWCRTKNTAGESDKTGHMTVQYKPVMYNTPEVVKTWRNNPTNVTCVAESIPNATITWIYRNREIQSGVNGFKIFGNGPVSNLFIEDPRSEHYDTYVCRATNTLGDNEVKINVKEVFQPSRLNQVVLEKFTATAVTVTILNPNSLSSDLDIEFYIAEYRAVNEEEWKQEVWRAGLQSYTLGGLVPSQRYDFRFAAQNKVGIGEFYSAGKHTMPARSAPEVPVLMMMSETSEVTFSTYSDRFDVRWQVPLDNGEQIDYFQLVYYKVSNRTGKWIKLEDFNSVERDNDGTNNYEISNLEQDTYYRVEIRAHNALGLSKPAEAVFKTVRGFQDNGIVGRVEDKPESKKELKPAEIVGIIVGILVILLIVIDVSCCFMNKCGLTLFICTKLKAGDKDEEKSKRFVAEDGKVSCVATDIKQVTNNCKETDRHPTNDATVKVVDEKEPLRNGDNTTVDVGSDDHPMINREKSKENEAMDDQQSMDSDVKQNPPKDSAV